MVDPVALPKIFIPPCFVDQPEILTNWRYEYRQQAQKIDTHLFLGPLSIVKDAEFLAKNNIHVLISVADVRTVPAVVKHKYQPSGQFKCLSFDPGNRFLNPMRLVSQLMQVCGEIEDAEKTHNVSVLLYCETGNNSSALAAAAYMIYKYDYGIIKAVQQVQSSRFCTDFDDTARYNLQTFEGICKAQKPIEQMPRAVSKKSRGREEDEDEEEQMNSMYKNRQQEVNKR